MLWEMTPESSVIRFSDTAKESGDGGTPLDAAKMQILATRPKQPKTIFENLRVTIHQAVYFEVVPRCNQRGATSSNLYFDFIFQPQ